MHIVVIRFSSLGDIVLQTPILSWIKLNYPDSVISFVTASEFKSLVSEHPHIDKAYFLKRSSGKKDRDNIKSLVKKIESDQKIDFILDLHNTLRAKLFRLYAFSTPKLVVNKRSLLRWLLIKFKWDLLKNTSSHHFRLIEDFAALMNLDDKPENLTRKLNLLSEYEMRGVTSTPLSFKHNEKNIEGDYIVISPIASFDQKRWPIKSVNELLEKLLVDSDFDQYKFIIIAGPNDNYCQDIIKDTRVSNLQGKTNLDETMKILSFSKLCFTNDTGSLHMAESFGVPVLAIFGPTSESFGFKPHLKASRALSVDISCRPCSGTGSKKCYRDEPYCMTNISSEMVITHLKEMIKEDL